MSEEIVGELLEQNEIEIVNMTGSGGEYEEGCRELFLACLEYFEDNDLSPEEIVDEDEEGNLDSEVSEELPNEIGYRDTEDLEGPQLSAALSHALYVRRFGYKSWIENANNDRVEKWSPSLLEQEESE